MLPTGARQRTTRLVKVLPTASNRFALGMATAPNSMDPRVAPGGGATAPAGGSKARSRKGGAGASSAGTARNLPKRVPLPGNGPRSANLFTQARDHRLSGRPMLEAHSHFRHLERSARLIQREYQKRAAQLQQQQLQLQQQQVRLQQHMNAAMNELHDDIGAAHARCISRSDMSTYDAALKDAHESHLREQRSQREAAIDAQARCEAQQAAGAASSSAPTHNADATGGVHATPAAEGSAHAASSSLSPSSQSAREDWDLGSSLDDRGQRRATRSSTAASASLLEKGEQVAAASTSEAASTVAPPAVLEATPEQSIAVVARYKLLIAQLRHDHPEAKRHTKAISAFYSHELKQLQLAGVTIHRSAIKNWCARGPKTQRTSGRPADSTAETTRNTVAAMRLGREQTGNGAAKSAVKQRLQEEATRMQFNRGRGATALSESAMRRAMLLLMCQTASTTRPDDACRTISRQKAECYRNGVATAAVLDNARCGPRLLVDAATAKANPVDLSLWGNADETKTVMSNGHGKDGREEVMVPYNDADQHIRGATQQGSHMPLAFSMHLHVFADCSAMAMHSIKLVEKQTTFLLDRNGHPKAPADKSCFHITLPTRHSRPLRFRFIRAGTKEDVYSKDDLIEFVLRNIASQRAKLIKLYEKMGIDFSDPSERARLLSSVTTSDGAGGLLRATVEHIFSGQADRDCEQFVKKASAATGILGYGNECDLGDFFNSFKKFVRRLEREYHHRHGAGSNAKQLPQIPGRAPVPEGPVPKQVDSWVNWEANPAVMAMKAAIHGKNATLGFTVQKWQMICRYVYICAMYQGEATSPMKVSVAFSRGGDAGTNRKAIITQSPGFTSLPVSVREQIMSEEFAAEARQEVLRTGTVGGRMVR